MANRKISEFTALTAPASGDTFAILDVDASGIEVNKKITYANVLGKAPDGTAAAPAFSFSSDTNSGISGGSDTLVLSTGGTAAISVDSSQNVTLSANLTVSGTTTVIDTTTLTVKDKNIEIAKGNGNDAAVDGAGITIDSTDGDKTWNWVDSTDAWTSSEHIHLGDNKKLLVGTGSDLEIYHDGTVSRVQDDTNPLYIKGSDIYLYKGGGAEKFIHCHGDAQVELYYNGVKQIETLSNGVRLKNGHLHLNESDGMKILLGASDDLAIYHSGDWNYIKNHNSKNLAIQVGSGGDENAIIAIPDGEVQLYYDTSKKLETTSAGATCTGDFTVKGDSGSAEAFVDLARIDDPANNQNVGVIDFSQGSASSRLAARIITRRDGGVWGASSLPTRFEFHTCASGSNTAVERVRISSTGNLQIPNDTGKIQLGASQDLQIYHTGSFSKIVNSTGDLNLYADTNVGIYNAAGSELKALFATNGAVDLYYDNSKKLETTSTGSLFHTSLKGADNADILLGNSDDLQIYHDGTHSRIDNSTGYLTLRSNQIALQNAAGDHDYVKCSTNEQGVELYYDNSKKLETYSSGVEITGDYLYLPDNIKLSVGSFGDLQVYHDGSNSYIDQNGTGDLLIRQISSGSIELRGDTNELMGKFRRNLGVELYYDNSKKLHTHTAGITVTGYIQMDGTEGSASAGNIYIEDNGKAIFGNGSDLQIYHDGTNSIIDNNTGWLQTLSDNHALKDKDDGDNMIVARHDGAVELYHDGSLQCKTASYGLDFADNKRADFGDGNDLLIYHDGTDSYLDNSTGELALRSDTIRLREKTGNETLAVFERDGAAKLYYDNAKHFETTSTGVSWGTTRLRCDDNGMIELGTGQDLKIYHDGSHSFIKDDGTGNLHIDSVAGSVKIRTNTNEDSLVCNQDGAVELYYDNSKKFETNSNGIRILGDSQIWFDAWQGRLDRNWDDYPSITITPSTTYGNQGEFRVHGQSGSLGGYGSGADFSIDFRVDGAYQTGSDRRRKSNIEDITGALATVKQLTGKKFNIINRQGDLDPNKSTKKQFGLIAQECEDIIPEVITFHPNENTPNENGWCSAYGLDYGQLTPLLINAIKELSAKVDTLETKVAALEAA